MCHNTSDPDQSHCILNVVDHTNSSRLKIPYFNLLWTVLLVIYNLNPLYITFIY